MRIRVGRLCRGSCNFVLLSTLTLAQDLVLHKLVLSECTDMPGGDIASIFDTR